MDFQTIVYEPVQNRPLRVGLSFLDSPDNSSFDQQAVRAYLL